MTNYLQKNKDVYRFRIRVPDELQDLFGKKIITTSLKTKNLSIASARAEAMSNSVKNLFNYTEAEKPKLNIDKVNMLLSVSYKESMNEILFLSPDIPTLSDDQIDDIKLELGVFNEMLDTGNYKPRLSYILTELVDKGAHITPENSEFNSLARFVVASKISEMHRTIEVAIPYRKAKKDRFHDEAKVVISEMTSTLPTSSTALAEELKEDTSILFSVAYTKYLNELTLEPKTVHAMKASYGLFEDLCGDLKLDAIDKDSILKFKEALVKTPKNLKQRFPDKSIKEVVDLKHGLPTISPTTINKHIQWVSSVLKWANSNGLRTEPSPAEGMNVKENKREKSRNERFPFKMEQVRQIFSSPIFKGCKAASTKSRHKTGDVIVKDSWYWIPLLGLYTGARLQELCQLYVEDVKEVEGVWVLDLNEAGNDKSLKTASSLRLIPIHNKLIELGFIGYIKTLKRKRVFEGITQAVDGTYSSMFSKRFGRYLERINVKEKKQSFHSFRHNMSDTLKNLDVPESVIKAILGHTDDSETFGRYGSEYKVKTLQEHLNKISYPVDL